MQPTEIPAQTRLLKANDVRGLGSKVVFNFDDLRQRGDAYVESVRKQVGEMLASAEAEVVTLAKVRRTQLGFEEGQRDGLAERQRSDRKASPPNCRKNGRRRAGHRTARFENGGRIARRRARPLDRRMGSNRRPTGCGNCRAVAWSRAATQSRVWRGR